MVLSDLMVVGCFFHRCVLFYAFLGFYLQFVTYFITLTHNLTLSCSKEPIKMMLSCDPKVTVDWIA